MPEPNDHIIKSNHNKAFADSITDEEYSDWRVTILFYSGLHWINAYLHLRFKADDEDICGHDLLKDYLDAKGLPSLKQNYKNFQKLSHTARYGFKDMSSRAIVAEDYLKSIKKLCILSSK